MAGKGSRFVVEGYTKPKPFIDMNGQPMIVRVLDNLQYPKASYILIAQKQHMEAERELIDRISQIYNVTWVTVDQLTEGTACTILFARDKINNKSPLLIANSDQLVDGGIKHFVEKANERNLDGSILCFKDEKIDSKWSFAKVVDGYVKEVREKEPISDIATVGIYYFARGKDFVDSAIDMIVRNERTNNEFYTCPVYNYMLKKQFKIGIEMIKRAAMHGIGTPKDLEIYLRKYHA